MKIFKTFTGVLFAALLLAACGGGGSTLTGSGGGTGGGTTSVASIAVATSPATVAADGSTSAAISAVAVNSSNVAVAGITLAFSVSSGGVLTVGNAVTDATGTATASVKALANTTATSLTVTAASGTISGNTMISVVALQQTLSLSTDSPQIPSDGSKAAILTAQLLDANNNALPGVTVHFGTLTGALTVTQAVTDASGFAKATLSAGTDPTNRRITVTVTAGSAPAATVPVDVSGTSLSLTGPANLVLNNVGTYSVLLTDSSGKGISNRTVAVSSANGNTLSAATVVTDGTGTANVNLTATSTANGGADTVTATALGLTANRAITVSSENFSITAPANNTKINLGTSVPVNATWLSGSTPQVGATVNFSSTRGTLSSATATTNSSGVASVNLSSTNAGPAVVSASATGVTAQTNVDFVATSPSQVAVQASPAAVAVQGQSTITATVRDAQNNLVEGQTVNFVLTDSTGGSLSVASAITDTQGRAQSVYTAGNTTSAANGVSVAASVQGTSVTNTVTLTVGGQTVFLSLGTGNTINSPDQATYAITYAVLAIDSQGAAIANAPITLRVLPVNYIKGYRVWSDVDKYWDTAVSTLPGESSCANEDTDYTGNMTSLGLDAAAGRCLAAPYGSTVHAPVKDYNCSGALEPGNVANVSPSSGNTGTDGKLLVSVTYPKDHAYYVTVQLVATTNVNGTQGSTSSTFLLPGAAADFSTQSIGPPGPNSPYGYAAACSSKL